MFYNNNKADDEKQTDCTNSSYSYYDTTCVHDQSHGPVLLENIPLQVNVHDAGVEGLLKVRYVQTKHPKHVVCSIKKKLPEVLNFYNVRFQRQI